MSVLKAVASNGSGGGGGGGGVTSIDGITGAVTLVAGSNITITDNSPGAGDITIASTGGGGTPGGSDMQIQYNNSGAFGGAAAVYFDNGTNYFGAGLQDTGSLTLTHPFQVGGGNSYAAPTSISGVITYYTPPASPATGSASANYAQPLIDSTGFTLNNQVDIGSPNPGVYYTADNTVSLNYYIAGYNIVAGERQYSPGVTTISFADNNDGNGFYVDLAWAAITGATGYVIWRNGTYNGNTATYESIDLAAATTLQDTGFAFWGSTIAYPPTPQHLTYLASGQTVNYRVYDYTVPVGGINLYSTTFKQINFTDDNRSQHPPATGTIGYTAGVGTYSSNSNLTHSYYIWSQYADGGFSSTQLSESINVPNTTIGNPASITATQNPAGSGYTANGYSGTYYVRAYKSTPAGYVYSGTASIGFTDDSSATTYSVDLAWPTVTGADGYIVYLNGEQFSVTYASINAGNVLAYNDNATISSPNFPFSQNQPSSLSAIQNDAETGYTADGTNIFTYNMAAYWNTGLGKIYSAPSGCQTGFTDNSDASPFGVDLTWAAASTDPNGTNPDGYELWVVGGVHTLNTAQDVGNVTSFADQNNTWGTLSYQINGSSAYNFFYEINLSWLSVPTITAYYVTKSGGDSGWSYNYQITTASLSITDTDDSIWTAGAVNPPTPVELDTYYNVSTSYAAVGGVTAYRTLKQNNGGGYTTAHDFAGTSFVDNDGSFPWSGSTTVTNTLYHATGATIPIKAYSYNNADAIYSGTFASSNVTDNNSGNYYSILWTASNYPTGADKLKLIINTTNGELLTSPTLTYTDVNQGYNSNTTVTPSVVSALFYSNRVGDVTVGTLTASTYVDTPKIGTGTGLMQLGSGTTNTGTDAIVIGNSAYSNIIGGIAIGVSATAQNGAYATAIGHGANALSGDALAIGSASSAGHSGTAIGPGTNATTGATAIGSSAIASGSSSVAIGDSAQATASAGTAIGSGATCSSPGGNAIGQGSTASNFQSSAFGYSSHATGVGALAIGFGVNASGDESFAGGYQANSGATGALALGYQAAASNTNAISIGRSNICSGSNAISIGTSSTASTNFSIAMGYAATAAGLTDIAIGFGANSASNTGMALGTSCSVGSATASVSIGVSVSNTVANSLNIGIGSTRQIRINTVDYFMLRPRGNAAEKILGDADVVIYNGDVITYSNTVVYY